MASQLKATFRRVGRSHSSSTVIARSASIHDQPTENSPLLVVVENEDDRVVDIYGNETRELSGTQSAFERPMRKDKRWWVRWPAKIWWFMIQRWIGHSRRHEYRPISHWSVRWADIIWRVLRPSGPLNSTMGPLLQSRLKFLLIFLPLALLAAQIPMAPDIVFTFCFLAIISLSGIVQLACEHLSTSLGFTLQGLLVAFSDNIVELVIGVVSLSQGQLRLLQLNLMGSALCYSVLILGSCFFMHGIRYLEGPFNTFAAKSIASLNLVGCCLLLVPTMLYVITQSHDWGSHSQILNISRTIALIYVLLYCVYIFFMLRTHNSLHDSEEPEVDEEEPEASASTGDISTGPKVAIAWLIVSLAFIAICMLTLLANLQGSIWESHKNFLGFILFPFLGNTTDFLDACVVAWKDQLDITIRVTLGSSMQILLFTLPFQIVLGWVIDRPLTLQLGFFEAITVLLSVIIVGDIVHRGKCNYFTGATCIALYGIIALAAFNNQDNDDLFTLGT